jgi:dienelactone hydrolase
LLAVAVVLVGCGSARPVVDVGNGSAAGTPPATLPAGDAWPPARLGDSAAPTDPAGTETTVWIPAGDHRVPGTLAMPASAIGQRVPAVLLLHGDLSNRDENGNLFGRLAAALSARGIASLRIDFAGSGESEEPDLALDYPNMVSDAGAAFDYLGQDQRIDTARRAVLGMSRGGSIAATLAGTVPGVAALVSWSGAIANGFEEDPDAHETAREDGYVTVALPDRDFELSLAWFDTILDSHPLDDVAGYARPVLAVVGSDDDVVPPEVADTFLATVASKDTTLYTIDGADHGFAGEEQYGDDAISVTTDWLVSRLTAGPIG